MADISSVIKDMQLVLAALDPKLRVNACSLLLATERAEAKARNANWNDRVKAEALARRANKKEERQAQLIADGWVWITYQGERRLWDPAMLPVGGVRDNGRTIQYDAT